MHFKRTGRVSKNNTIVNLRFPFVRSEQGDHIEELISAFLPVVEAVVQVIYEHQSRSQPVPILCFGKNSIQQIHTAIQMINHPKFNIISSVHPSWFVQIENKIIKSKNNRDRLHLLEVKYSAIDIFKSSMYSFRQMISHSE